MPPEISERKAGPPVKATCRSGVPFGSAATACATSARTAANHSPASR